MTDEEALTEFISNLARRIESNYPTNCADAEDYIQAGHLKLAEISAKRYKKRNFKAYAIISVARSMRRAAIDAMFAVSAPHRVKARVHKIAKLLAAGASESDICQELCVSKQTLSSLRSLLRAESWHGLFEEPEVQHEPFVVLSDLLSVRGLTDEDRQFMIAQSTGTVESLGLSRKQRWSQANRLRQKISRSGYGT